MIRSNGELLLAIHQQRQLLADALPILVMIADSKGHVRFFNRAWYDFTGDAPNRLFDWAELVHPDDREAVLAAWAGAVEDSARNVGLRYRLRHAASDSYRWVSAQAAALPGADGTVGEWIGVTVDGQGDRRADAALRELLDMQDALVETFQRALLPAALPDICGVQIDSYYRASGESGRLGGDWFDAVLLADGQLVFSIGDVVGHGVHAAAEMSRARQSILTVAANGATAAMMLQWVNRVMVLQGTMATALVGHADAERGRLTLASAGHPRAIHRAAGGAVSEILAEGVPLGIFEQLEWRSVEVTLTAGDTIVAYTDGLVEFRREIAAAELELIHAVIAEDDWSRGCAERLANSVIGEADLPDDVALLTMHFVSLGVSA